VTLHLHTSGVYVSGTTTGTLLFEYRERFCTTNKVLLPGNTTVASCGANTGNWPQCTDVFVLKLNANSLAEEYAYQIGPPSCGITVGTGASETCGPPGPAGAGCPQGQLENWNYNDADEPIGALSCEQNVPSLTGSSC
jgi:hypothetical protein